jgi:hypothetical protein
VKVHHITALGVDLIVLPPDLDRVQLSDGLLFGTPAVGDIVDGDIECPNLLYHQGLYGCGRCWGSGTVSVPHEVREVLTIQRSPLAGEPFVQLANGTVISSHLPPDAKPGGVCLLVKPFRETP